MYVLTSICIFYDRGSGAIARCGTMLQCSHFHDGVISMWKFAQTLHYIKRRGIHPSKHHYSFNDDHSGALLNIMSTLVPFNPALRLDMQAYQHICLLDASLETCVKHLSTLGSTKQNVEKEQNKASFSSFTPPWFVHAMNELHGSSDFSIETHNNLLRLKQITVCSKFEIRRAMVEALQGLNIQDQYPPLDGVAPACLSPVE